MYSCWGWPQFYCDTVNGILSIINCIINVLHKILIVLLPVMQDKIVGREMSVTIQSIREPIRGSGQGERREVDKVQGKNIGSNWEGDRQGARKEGRELEGRKVGNKEHSFMQRPIHPSFGRTELRVDGWWMEKMKELKVFKNPRYCQLCLRNGCK